MAAGGASGVSQATKSEITLKGSVEIVSEFFGFAINSILYQRGIYPAEGFEPVSKYGLEILVTQDEGLKNYLGQVLSQLTNWLTDGSVQKLVVVVTGATSGETLERWVFNVEADEAVREAARAGGEAAAQVKGGEKDLKTIQGEIRAIIRQITATNTFLPLLDEPCSFDLLVYTDKDTSVPRAWEESDPKYVRNSEEVKLRSFTTTVHKVDGAVTYRVDGGDDEV